MTNDELRAAAEHVAERYSDMACMVSGLTPLQEQSLIVARALLELLPAEDDGEPIDSKWLDAVGGTRHQNRGRSRYFNLPILNGIWADYRLGVSAVHGGGVRSAKAWAVCGEPGEYRVVSLCRLRTRGDLRKLASAMGITLKGTHDAPAVSQYQQDFIDGTDDRRQDNA